MDILRELEKIGIIPRNQLKIEEKNYIAKQVADKLSSNIKELSETYNELYMRIFNCDMYYADTDSKFYGVFYYYKNNTIYINSDKDLSNVDSYIMHECIHYLQNFSKINKNSNRAGICEFREFKIFGLGINEALVQYLTAKALGNKIARVNTDVVTICTNSGNYYKYMTSLITQILLLMGEKEAVGSCIYSTDDFENELYNTFEENTEKIVKNFDIILDENNKPDRDENKIINIYMQTQQLIYTTYFTKMYKRLTTSREVDEQVQKLENYNQIIGKRLMVTEEDFINFKSEMDSQFLKKYIEVNRRKTNNSLTVIYKSLLQNIWSKITNFIQNIIVK